MKGSLMLPAWPNYIPRQFSMVVQLVEPVEKGRDGTYRSLPRADFAGRLYLGLSEQKASLALPLGCLGRLLPPLDAK